MSTKKTVQVLLWIFFLAAGSVSAAAMKTGPAAEPPCQHSSNLTPVHHTALAHVQYLLAEACDLLGVDARGYSIELVRYSDGRAYNNAQICRSSGSIYLGLSIWEHFHDREHIIIWMLAHELGHDTHRWDGLHPRLISSSPEELRFLEGFTRGQRIELASDREAAEAMLRRYALPKIREAIVELALLMGSPTETTDLYSHPGYYDRLRNVDFHRRRLGHSVGPGREQLNTLGRRYGDERRNYSTASEAVQLTPPCSKNVFIAPAAAPRSSSFLPPFVRYGFCWLKEEGAFRHDMAPVKSHTVNVQGRNAPGGKVESGQARFIGNDRARPAAGGNEGERNARHGPLVGTFQKLYAQHVKEVKGVGKWGRAPSLTTQTLKTDSSFALRKNRPATSRWPEPCPSFRQAAVPNMQLPGHNVGEVPAKARDDHICFQD